jgi:SAM-dependent methyltransferase
MTQPLSLAARTPLSPAAEAFDAIAEAFDDRFGSWLSVAAQRRAVRAQLLAAFPHGARVLEIGGGTGEDACWLMRQGRTVLLTDPSPTMVRIAASKLAPLGGPTPVPVAAEDLATLAEERSSIGAPIFDGAFSNFAALNCVQDLSPIARGLSRLVRPGAALVLVVFGVCAPGEWIVEASRGNRRAVFRRASRGDVRARVGGREFFVRYHRGSDIARTFAPWFRLTRRRGIGVFVPPSASEPWISRHPRLLSVLDGLDRVASRPLAMFGDHVLYRFERTDVDATV